MPLHLQYRPSNLDEFFGNERLKSSLRTILDMPDHPRTFLFTGPSGCGKTTLARIMAKAWGCGELDYYELNISDARGIDEARRIITETHYGPITKGGKVKFYVLDECQDATGNFQNALLKSLEDTPPHVVFVLCTTDPQKLKRAIKTRCSTFAVEPLPGPTMRKLVNWILEQENTALPEGAMEELVKAAGGSPREAVVILNQVIDIADDAELIAAIQGNRPLEATVKDLAEALLNNRPWKEVAAFVQVHPEGTNWEQVRMEVLRYCGGVLLRHGTPKAAQILAAFRDPVFNSGRAGIILACYNSRDQKLL